MRESEARSTGLWPVIGLFSHPSLDLGYEARQSGLTFLVLPISGWLGRVGFHQRTLVITHGNFSRDSQSFLSLIGCLHPGWKDCWWAVSSRTSHLHMLLFSKTQRPLVLAYRVESIFGQLRWKPREETCAHLKSLPCLLDSKSTTQNMKRSQ